MSNEVVPIGLIGDTGLVGKEIDKILVHHDKVKVVFRQNSERRINCVDDCVLVFLATKDNVSIAQVAELLPKAKRLIDMSGAFRIPPNQFEQSYGIKHTAPELFEHAIYGLPAYFKEAITEAQLVANPGCYAAAVVLALRPLEQLAEGPIIIKATSGNSGARKEAEAISSEETYSHGTKHKHFPCP